MDDCIFWPVSEQSLGTPSRVGCACQAVALDTTVFVFALRKDTTSCKHDGKSSIPRYSASRKRLSS
jgi:hypothetical protein